MKMYSREDLMNMKNFGGEEDADDDEDDDETRFPSKLVRIKTNRFPFFLFFCWLGLSPIMLIIVCCYRERS